MERNKRDILAERPELKKIPYSTPEGYFESFKIHMRPYRTKPAWKRVAPYASVAAALLFLLSAGAVFMQRNSLRNNFTQEDFLVFSGSVVDMEYYEEADRYADAEIVEEDIIEYLIYSGMSVEEIEYYK